MLFLYVNVGSVYMEYNREDMVVTLCLIQQKRSVLVSDTKFMHSYEAQNLFVYIGQWMYSDLK